VKITGADHTNWRVKDLERSLRFYRDILGLEPFGLEEYDRGERPIVSLRVTPTFILHLRPDPNFEPGPTGGYDHLALVVEGTDPEALARRLGEAQTGRRGGGPGRGRGPVRARPGRVPHRAEAVRTFTARMTLRGTRPTFSSLFQALMCRVRGPAERSGLLHQRPLHRQPGLAPLGDSGIPEACAEEAPLDGAYSMCQTLRPSLFAGSKVFGARAARAPPYRGPARLTSSSTSSSNFSKLSLKRSASFFAWSS
jgi:catechol 2,3-dioxygenase-like lactoylglutathione lyase family enzyme